MIGISTKMALPFGCWDVGESFNQAVQIEEEEEDHYEVEEGRTEFQVNIGNNEK